MAEQRTVNPLVVGSTPTSSAMKTYEISSFQEIDIALCFEEYMASGCFVLRGYDMSRDEQLSLMKSFGDITKWFPNNQRDSGHYTPYRENHSHTIDMRNLENATTGTDDILVVWHMEHIGFPNPAVGASWNMRTFTCSPNSGKTFFVDGIQLYQNLSQDDAEFLKKSLYVEQAHGAVDSNHPIYCPIKKHYLTGNEMVYMPPNTNIPYGDKLCCDQGRQWGEKERQRFETIMCKIANTIKYDASVQFEHRWQQYDVVFADLSRLYHAVTGGFSSEERIFDGIFAHALEGDMFLVMR